MSLSIPKEIYNYTAFTIIYAFYVNKKPHYSQINQAKQVFRYLNNLVIKVKKSTIICHECCTNAYLLHARNKFNNVLRRYQEKYNENKNHKSQIRVRNNLLPTATGRNFVYLLIYDISMHANKGRSRTRKFKKIGNFVNM